ncbi:MAG: hypothetical protein EXR63_03730 [Dehalococcoidia bacterium]|nr:hypothetical protein [Dehalococcoidia bacterium]
MTVDGALAALTASLDAGRAALLAALGQLGERDFALELAPGETVIGALAALAPAERGAVAEARAAAGLPPRPLASSPGPRARPTPPQVVHDLAGARHETLRLLAELAATPRPERAGTALLAASLAALAGVAARELGLAARIAGRPPGDAPGGASGA